MKLLILLTLTWKFALSSKGCTVGHYRGGQTLHVDCNDERYYPRVLDAKEVSCELNELNNTSWMDNIESILVTGCSFNNFNLFKNCTSVYLKDAPRPIQKETFSEMKKLSFIRFDSSSEIQASAFSELPNLRQVTIMNHYRNFNSFMFRNAHQLKVLRIHYSYGLLLPFGLFSDLSGLEKLQLGKFGYVSSSSLNDIDFTGLESVKWLRIDFTISNLNGNWCHIMKNLRYLFLSGNEIEDIDSITFSQMDNLIVLNLHDNHIKQLNADIFTGLTNLRTLLLQQNKINQIEIGAFSGLKRLKKLDLSHNELTALDEHTFDGIDNLQYLRLKGNRISTINVNTFSALAKLIQMDLSKQDGLVTIDLKAFPQFINLQTKTVIYTTISSEPEDFELEDRRWFRDILSFNKYQEDDFMSRYFRQFVMDKNQNQQIDLHNLTQNVTGQSLIFGNLDLSNNGPISIIVD